MDDAAAISNVLDVDDQYDSWTLDDVPFDSGAFGELVSCGLLEQTGDAYRVAHPAAVRAALDDENEEKSAESESSRFLQSGTVLNRTAVTERLRTIDALAVRSLLDALFMMILARAYVYGSIFRYGAVVFSGNDPYYYRYWVEQALAEAGGLLDFSAFATVSKAVQTGEPLLVATPWAFASLFGGDATAAGWVLAWYLVVAAVITAYLVYRLTMVVTDDRRVALTALLFLAVKPAYAFQTSLGFADHHAFSPVLLTLGVLGVLVAGKLIHHYDVSVRVLTGVKVVGAIDYVRYQNQSI